MENNASLVQYSNTGNILQDMRGIIEVDRESAYQAVNAALVQRASWTQDRGRRTARRESSQIWAGDYQNAVQRAD